MSRKQLVLVICTPILVFLTWIVVDLFLMTSQPHSGICIALCANLYNPFWGDCCKNGILQQTVGVYFYPYAAFIEVGILIVELLSAVVLFKKWQRNPKKK